MPEGKIVLTYLGPEDLYLTTDPQMTFFKCVYKRPSQFSIETRREVFGNEDYGRMCKCRLTKNAGDLVKNINLQLNFEGLNYNSGFDDIYNNGNRQSNNVQNNIRQSSKKKTKIESSNRKSKYSKSKNKNISLI